MYMTQEKKSERTITLDMHFNPLNPKSGQHQISPCNINAL